MPAPIPRTAEATAGSDQSSPERPTEFFDKDKAPPDEAPIEDLLDYWTRWSYTSSQPDPSDAVKQRLLEASLQNPDHLSQFLPWFSQLEGAAAKLKSLYDQAPSNQETNESWREKVREWLLFNSKYFLGDLLAQANKVKDNDKSGSIDKADALKALAKVDWPTAEPLLQRLSNGAQQRTATLALGLLYKQARSTKDFDAEEKYRAGLQAIAADRNAVAHARDEAIEVLSLTEWSGRDDWYLSLFQDETLIDPSDGSYGFSPLRTLFLQDPDKWIPIMTRLVESKDKTVRSAAATCLVSFQNRSARKDALKPLIPWLSNPEWAKNNRDHRLRLIQSMEDIDLPESVPGLIWAVEHDDDYESSYAARSLAKYKDPRAVPALKKALATEKDEEHRKRIVQGLMASGGLAETEQVEALEAYAAKLTTAEGREDIGRYRSRGDDPLSIPVSIGNYLSRMEDIPAPLVRAVLARAAVLQKSNAPLAQSLLEVAHRWQGRQIDLDLIDRIATGAADAATIANALERRAKLRESVGPELQALIGHDGAAPGIAAALLEDSSLAQSVLSSGDQLAKVALLACGRLLQMRLPIETVGALMKSKSPLLATAAESYLLAEDSKAARSLLWAHHPGVAFITGWRQNIDTMGGDNFDAMGQGEEKLQAELFKQDNPQEIFALLANAEKERSRVLRVYQNKAVYTYYENSTRYRERAISSAELAAFKSFVMKEDLEELGPQISYCHHDCWSSELLLLTKEKGRRVFSQQGFGGWQTLLANFDRLLQGEGARTQYVFEKEIPGLEILYEDDTLVVKDVWQRGNEIRLLVERNETPEETDARLKDLNDAEDEDDEAARARRQSEEIARRNARFSWRVLANRQVGGPTAQPEGYSTLDESKFPIENEGYGRSERNAQLISADSIVRARNFDGLWRQVAGQKAVRISGEEGVYLHPIVTSDRIWVVVAKTDSDWAKPNYVVRFNLQTGREYRVNILPADDFMPVAYLAPHGKVLLRRAKDDDEPARNKSVGPDSPEYYLLDAATGQTQLTSGVFTPLLQEGDRFLQPTGTPYEFWAAIPDWAKEVTQVGRYNLKDFSFQPLLVVPHITFDSMSMWVDEAGTKLYLVYRGQLLRVPLGKPR